MNAIPDLRYPYVATEVLCSEIWSIVETCISPSNNLLATFWETVLDRSPEDMKTQMVMASQFAKINSVFLSKKPAEVNALPIHLLCCIERNMNATVPLDACLYSSSTKRCRTPTEAH